MPRHPNHDRARRSRIRRHAEATGQTYQAAQRSLAVPILAPGAGHAATVGDALISRRLRAGLSAQDAATRADISLEQYSALESGSFWPGQDVLDAVLDLLAVPDSEREPFAFFGTPPSDRERILLTGSTGAVMIVDYAWRTIEVNDAARGLLPAQACRPGGSLMRWVLLDDTAPRLLLNHDAVARGFAGYLRRALEVAPADAEFVAIRDTIDQDVWEHASTDVGTPSGLSLQWHTEAGTTPVTALMGMTPGC
ncbi:helix-turn-helix domain-containing protein [Streptomyces sp. N35]|uniref:MmyB family transcriptional regulator n=1 Tax=Streptomyces sp. N35 TaxID=2795730 RepID=UPI0018F7BA7D|nr:helix-turn-helix domain-containing protein [Streptomyces sp. N35]